MNLAEAERTHAKLIELKAAHAVTCLDCTHPQFCRQSPCNHGGLCQVANTWDRIIAAAAVQIETAKVVATDGQA